MNGGVADYLETGTWSNKAYKEAKRYEALGLGQVNLVAADSQTQFSDIPDPSTWQLTKGQVIFIIAQMRPFMVFRCLMCQRLIRPSWQICHRAFYLSRFRWINLVSSMQVLKKYRSSRIDFGHHS